MLVDPLKANDDLLPSPISTVSIVRNVAVTFLLALTPNTAFSPFIKSKMIQGVGHYIEFTQSLPKYIDDMEKKKLSSRAIHSMNWTDTLLLHQAAEQKWRHAIDFPETKPEEKILLLTDIILDSQNYTEKLRIETAQKLDRLGKFDIPAQLYRSIANDSAIVINTRMRAQYALKRLKNYGNIDIPTLPQELWAFVTKAELRQKRLQKIQEDTFKFGDYDLDQNMIIYDFFKDFILFSFYSMLFDFLFSEKN
jgi:hypothetical protein